MINPWSKKNSGADLEFDFGFEDKSSNAKNANLHRAKSAKNDEFYTQLSDIEAELSHYPKDTFKDKIVYCPCDMPSSNFVKYFTEHKELGIKKLIHTSIQEGYDFRSDYCTQLLKEADIVVTNPPFSLFREFVAWLMKYEKKFIIVGNQNAITYKEIFPLIRENKMWLGVPFKGLAGHFYSPYEDTATASDHKENMIRVSGVCWFTNADLDIRHEPMVLYKQYNEHEYPKYDNYDAIEISNTKDIPVDYDGVMGVPITWLYKYCPEQFEIIGTDLNEMVEELGIKPIGEDWIRLYRSQGGKGHITANMHSFVYTKNGKAVSVYKRILIRRKAEI